MRSWREADFMIGPRQAKQSAAQVVAGQRNWNGDSLFVVLRRESADQ